MTLAILDTDSASLFLSGNVRLINRITQRVPHIATTIITVQELYNGWSGRINDPAEATNLVRLYGKLLQTTEFLKSIEILAFSELANTYYQNLLLENRFLAKKRLEKDVRIAAIALSVGGTVITRNHKDFAQIPNIKIEDWTT
jgi:tRNA(fMet)-specific endonuclease VapC